jgi:hypothetical protein
MVDARTQSFLGQDPTRLDFRLGRTLQYVRELRELRHRLEAYVFLEEASDKAISPPRESTWRDERDQKTKIQSLKTVPPEPLTGETKGWYPDPGHWVVWCIYVSQESRPGELRLNQDRGFIRSVLEHLDDVLGLQPHPSCTFSVSCLDAEKSPSSSPLASLYSELKQKPNIVVLWSTAENRALASRLPFLRTIPRGVTFLPILVGEVKTRKKSP